MQAILRKSVPWLVSAVQKAEDGGAKKPGIKIVQAVEKFRRFIIQVKNSERDPIISKTLVQLLHDVASCFDSAFEQVWDVSHPSFPGLTRVYSLGMKNFALLSLTPFWFCRKVD